MYIRYKENFQWVIIDHTTRGIVAKVNVPVDHIAIATKPEYHIDYDPVCELWLTQSLGNEILKLCKHSYMYVSFPLPSIFFPPSIPSLPPSHVGSITPSRCTL